MFNFTEKLFSHLRDNHGLKGSATEAETLKLAAKLYASGDISPAKMKELTDGPDKLGQLKSFIKGTVEEAVRGTREAAFESNLRGMERRLNAEFEEKYGPASRDTGNVKSILAMGAGLDKSGGEKFTKERQMDGTDIETIERPRINVKDPSARYCDIRTKAYHVKTKQPVIHNGAEIENPSQKEYAKIGAYLKFLASKKDATIMLTEHEQSLVLEMIEKDWWVQESNDAANYIKGSRVKAAILDSATSGGSYTNPLWWDDMIVTIPLLTGEVLPHVEIVEVPRGTTVNGALVGNPTLSWGTAEGSNITLFDATALISQITATIYPVLCVIEIGRDYLSDQIANVGQVLVNNLMKRLGQELDKVIMAGSSGSGQPTGITGASGTTDVTFATPTAGPYVISDLLNMMFSVGKEYQTGARFVSTHTGYKKFRSIATGVTGDTRLVLGEDVRSYSALDAPWSIENQGLTNDMFVYGQMKCFRLWRRLGSEVRWSDQGYTLMRSNTMLLSLRGRYGGKVTNGAGFGISTSGIP